VTEVFSRRWIADYADPGFLDLFISGSSPSTFYGNTGFDELMAKAAAVGAERWTYCSAPKPG
jgi:ABC-type oligopeptide transport system substrate-binding subunit